MANKDAPFGLKPVGSVGSAIQNGGQTQYSIASGATTAIYMGDPVKMLNTGTITAAAAGNTILGVFNGCFYTDPTSSKPTFSNRYPGSISASDIVASVIDDPDAIFEVQSAATSGVQQTVVGNNADIVYTAGNNQSGVSKVEISGTTAATSAQLRIVGVSSDPSNNTLGTGSDSANVNLLVKINEHFYATTVGV